MFVLEVTPRSRILGDGKESFTFTFTNEKNVPGQDLVEAQIFSSSFYIINGGNSISHEQEKLVNVLGWVMSALAVILIIVPIVLKSV